MNNMYLHATNIVSVIVIQQRSIGMIAVWQGVNPEVCSSHNTRRLKSDLAAVMRKTPVPESQHFSDMASSLLQRLQQFDELEAASAQVW